MIDRVEHPKAMMEAFEARRLMSGECMGDCTTTGLTSAANSGVNVALGDGSVRFISDSIGGSTWNAAGDPDRPVVLGRLYNPYVTVDASASGYSFTRDLKSSGL